MARKRSRFVPRAVFGAGFGSVIPACGIAFIQACSNSTPPGVAGVAYCCFDAATGNDGDGDATDAHDATITDGANDVSADADGDAAKDAPEGG
jgi:hypothetical protein